MNPGWYLRRVAPGWFGSIAHRFSPCSAGGGCCSISLSHNSSSSLQPPARQQCFSLTQLQLQPPAPACRTGCLSLASPSLFFFFNFCPFPFFPSFFFRFRFRCRGPGRCRSTLGGVTLAHTSVGRRGHGRVWGRGGGVQRPALLVPAGWAHGGVVHPRWTVGWRGFTRSLTGGTKRRARRCFHADLPAAAHGPTRMARWRLARPLYLSFCNAEILNSFMFFFPHQKQ